MSEKTITDFTAIDHHCETRLGASLDELTSLARIPSIAAQRTGIDECAELVADLLRHRGFNVELHSTAGSPVVVAERAGRSDRTLLVYNHYDVQPAEPLELWTSPPFDPVERDGKFFGRGVSDDKGHFTARLLAIDALLAHQGELPCRVKFVVEGEEEVGSVHLPAFLRQQKQRLAADACLWEFGAVDHREVPILYAGLRGLAYVELSVETAAVDAHSGIGGSILANAAWRLTWALASLKGPDERIRIPGFYDKVRAPSARDRELIAALPETADEYRRRFGVKTFLGGLTGGPELREAEVFRPTCTICGLTAGYQGAGSKTVQPARASAKVDFRLVPDQDPVEIRRLLRAHLDAEGFPDVLIADLGGEAPGRTDPDHPFLKLACETATPVYGVPMQIAPMIGGSGPNHAFIEELGVPIVCAGLGYGDTRAHAPDENFRIDLYVKHAKHVARLMEGFAAAKSE